MDKLLSYRIVWWVYSLNLWRIQYQTYCLESNYTKIWNYQIFHTVEQKLVVNKLISDIISILVSLMLTEYPAVIDLYQIENKSVLFAAMDCKFLCRLLPCVQSLLSTPRKGKNPLVTPKLRVNSRGEYTSRRRKGHSFKPTLLSLNMDLSPCAVVAKVLNYDVVVSEFDF